MAPRRDMVPNSLWHERLVNALKALEAEAGTAQLHFKTEMGSGRLWFKEGRIIDAEFGDQTAHAAMFRLLGASDGSFEIEYASVDRAARMAETTQDLLDARSHRAAEWQRLLHRIPSLDLVPGLNRRVLDAQRGQLAPAEFELLELVDRRRTILELIDDSGLDALGVLERLVAYFELGLLEVSASVPSGFPPPRDE